SNDALATQRSATNGEHDFRSEDEPREDSRLAGARTGSFSLSFSDASERICATCPTHKSEMLPKLHAMTKAHVTTSALDGTEQGWRRTAVTSSVHPASHEHKPSEVHVPWRQSGL